MVRGGGGGLKKTEDRRQKTEDRRQKTEGKTPIAAIKSSEAESRPF
jgi:hypothetical protein